MKIAHRLILALLASALLAMVAASCTPHVEQEGYLFSATVEQPLTDSTATPQTKTYLHHEEWVYWEIMDRISIGGNSSGTGTVQREVAELLPPGEDHEGIYNAVFRTYLPYGSTSFLALYPYNEGNSIVYTGGGSNFANPTLVLPAQQPLRTDATADHTFGRDVYPMVAWYGGSEVYEQYNLDFHSLAGIVRLQLFNNSNPHTDVSVHHITVVADKQISGPVTVKDFKTSNPKPVSTSSAEANRTVTLTCGDGIALDSLRSFYLVLPAYEGENAAVTMALTVTVVTTDGLQCVKTLNNVKVRRRSISYPQALALESWNATTGTAGIGLSGNGTYERPFKIYRAKDLKYIQARFAAPDPETGNVTINGKVVTNETQFCLMRSDIELGTANWTAGIPLFKGHLYSHVSASSTPGITNNSNAPLFVDIAEGAVVDGITVRRTATSSLTMFSPFCSNNHGTIKNCRLANNGSGSMNNTGNTAGLCFTNYGTITGSSCVAKLAVGTSYNVAGVCYNNHGTIQGCFAGSPMGVSSAQYAAGVCYHNFPGGEVRDCYFAARLTGATSTISWGGVVYENQGLVEHCYISESAPILTTGEVGGIVCTNSGTIDYCWSSAQLRGRTVGGIVANMTGGRMVNCFSNDDLVLLSLIGNASAVAVGGLVGAMTGGEVANCFCHIDHTQLMGMHGVHGGLLGSAIPTSPNTISIVNCYAWEETTDSHLFVGHSEGEATYTNCHLVNGTQAIDGIATAADDAFDDLLDALNANVPDGGKGWLLDGGLPVFEPYYITPAR